MYNLTCYDINKILATTTTKSKNKRFSNKHCYLPPISVVRARARVSFFPLPLPLFKFKAYTVKNTNKYNNDSH